MSCLLVENYSNSRHVWSSRSSVQFLWGLRPNDVGMLCWPLLHQYVMLHVICFFLQNTCLNHIGLLHDKAYETLFFWKNATWFLEELFNLRLLCDYLWPKGYYQSWFKMIYASCFKSQILTFNILNFKFWIKILNFNFKIFKF